MLKSWNTNPSPYTQTLNKKLQTRNPYPETRVTDPAPKFFSIKSLTSNINPQTLTPSPQTPNPKA